MDAVRTIQGTAAPLRRSDVDTDQIIPSDWLKRIERTGFGAGLFSEWREEPDFVLNREEHAGASILVAGANFGVGSSREHAVWALVDYGFHAVISPRFGDIFRSNSTKAGLVTCQLEEEAAERLLQAVEDDPTLEVTVDVERLLVEAPAVGFSEPFPLDAFTRMRLLEGLDDIGLTLRNEADITAYEAAQADWLPATTAPSR
jgi:3-isopropylmalate/(R)-2-methylmalate dehydratase small subunit